MLANNKSVIICMLFITLLFSAIESRSEWQMSDDSMQLGDSNFNYNLYISPHSNMWYVTWLESTGGYLGKISVLSGLRIKKTNVSNLGKPMISQDGSSLLQNYPPSGHDLSVAQYDLDLNPLGPELNWGTKSMGNAVMNSEGEIVVAWAENEAVWLRKYDVAGFPVTDPFLALPYGVYAWHYQSINLWPADNGKIRMYFEDDSCLSTECDRGPYPKIYTFNTDLSDVDGVKNISLSTGYSGKHYVAPEKDNDILVMWLKLYSECDPEVMYFCWPVRREQWLLRLDELGNPKGVPYMFGMDELPPGVWDDDRDYSEFVGNYWEGAFVANPEGGFALVDDDEVHFFDGDGNIIQESVPVNRDASYTRFANASFDKTGRFLIAFWADSSNRFWGRIFKFVNCGDGQNIVYEDAGSGVTLTFNEITDSGYTEVTETQTGPEPDNFRILAPPVYYNITTTAISTGEITVCIPYDESQLSEPEDLIRLFHWDGNWEDITTTRDTVNNIVCGVTDSLSPFVMGIQNQNVPIILPYRGCMAGSGDSSGSPMDMLILMAPLFVIVLVRRFRLLKSR